MNSDSTSDYGPVQDSGQPSGDLSLSAVFSQLDNAQVAQRRPAEGQAAGLAQLMAWMAQPHPSNTAHPWAPDAHAAAGGQRLSRLSPHFTNTAFNESVSRHALFSLFLRSAAAAIPLSILSSIVITIFGAPGAFALAAGLSIGAMGFWTIMLLGNVTEPVNEWRVLLADKATMADAVYGAICGALHLQRIPHQMTARRVGSHTVSADVVTNLLVITEREYTARVSVFPYGTNLYAGWVMYRRRRGSALFVLFFKDLVASLSVRGDPTHRILRTLRIKAMHEAIHQATCDGIEAAVQGTATPLPAVFGAELPIEYVDSGESSTFSPGWSGLERGRS